MLKVTILTSSRSFYDIIDFFIKKLLQLSKQRKVLNDKSNYNLKSKLRNNKF